ncbi:unnamed protein product, partial [marine sediment metagenome]
DYARAQTLPTANAFGNYNFNKGRVPNEDDYSYVNQAFNNATVGMESRLEVFNGLYNLNSIRSSKLPSITGSNKKRYRSLLFLTAGRIPKN